MQDLEHQLLGVDKESLVRFILETVRQDTVEDWLRKDANTRQIKQLRTLVDQVLQRAAEESLSHSNDFEGEQDLSLVNTFKNIEILHKNMRAEILEDAKSRPFFVLEALTILVQAMWVPECGIRTRLPEGTYPLEDIDLDASKVLRITADNESFSCDEERILLLVAKNFPLHSKFSLYNDFGWQTSDVQIISGKIAQEILERMREATSISRKRVKPDWTGPVKMIDMAKKS